MFPGTENSQDIYVAINVQKYIKWQIYKHLYEFIDKAVVQFSQGGLARYTHFDLKKKVSENIKWAAMPSNQVNSSLNL